MRRMRHRLGLGTDALALDDMPPGQQRTVDLVPLFSLVLTPYAVGFSH